MSRFKTIVQSKSKVRATGTICSALALLLTPALGGIPALYPAAAWSAETQQDNGQKYKLAGLNVAVWKPAAEEKNAKAPIVIFSHGFGGSSTQVKFLMRAMAEHGYLVVAPDHADARGSKSTFGRPEISFHRAQEWSDSTYRARHDDIVKIIEALHNDPTWDNQIDWSKLALCGHSLGGYTVLGLGGAWPSWKLAGVKAIIALSPYTEPFVHKGALSAMNVPVMYQGGTRDFGITPRLLGPAGIYAKTASPAYLVVFERAGHLAWTNLNRNQNQIEEINDYCLAFLDKYIRNSTNGCLSRQADGVAQLKSK